jgi:hypothetical protein
LCFDTRFGPHTQSGICNARHGANHMWCLASICCTACTAQTLIKHARLTPRTQGATGHFVVWQCHSTCTLNSHKTNTCPHCVLQVQGRTGQRFIQYPHSTHAVPTSINTALHDTMQLRTQCLVTTVQDGRAQPGKRKPTRQASHEQNLIMHTSHQQAHHRLQAHTRQIMRLHAVPEKQPLWPTTRAS